MEIRSGSDVISVNGGKVDFRDGSAMNADLVIWATGAVAPPLLGKLGLATTKRGFLSTKRTLQSISQENIFAVGDTGTILSDDIPNQL